jgi:hypothetical protein
MSTAYLSDMGLLVHMNSYGCQGAAWRVKSASADDTILFLVNCAMKSLPLSMLSFPRELHPNSGLDLGTIFISKFSLSFPKILAGTVCSFRHFFRYFDRVQPSCSTFD